jgi:hypothetical protein
MTEKQSPKIRLSSHPLNIESLRGKVTNPNDRICNVCHIGEPETEIHFITICPKYDKQRQNLLNEIQLHANIGHLHGADLFIFLFTNENKIILKLLGNFIKTCFDIRKQHATS